MEGIVRRLKSFFAAPSAIYFFIAGAWGVAAIPCLCPACLAGPTLFFARGVAEHVPFLKKRMDN